MAEHGKLGVNFLADDAQLSPQALQGQGLEHVADDVVLNSLFGVLKVIIAAEKGDVGGRAYLSHMAGQLNARDKRHADIGEQQIRLILLHQLEGIQSVAGAAQ